MQSPGNTPCIRLPSWEEQLPANRVWVKDEQKNPTGTFKDRRSEMVLDRAKQEGADKVVLISMGNAAYSLAKYAEGTGIEVHAVVDTNLTEGIRKALKRVCTVTETDLHSDYIYSSELIEMVRTRSDETILDATNKFHEAYREIVRELKRDLPVQPDTIFMPFGAGEAMTGVLHGVEEVGWKDGTSVFGITNRSSERLKTDYINTAYLDCFEHGKRPGRLAVGIEPHISSEEIQRYCVPNGICSEEAAANVFYYVMVGRGQISLLLKDRNIVIINSGYGSVLDEAAKYSGQK